MKHEVIEKFNNTYYLLGVDESGEKYYLQRGTFDCKWYWSGGYIDTFNKSKTDIDSHQHWDTFFDVSELRHLNKKDAFTKFFKESPLSDDEWWILCELIESFYTARKAMGMSHRGGSNYTTNPLWMQLQNQSIYDYYKDTIKHIHEEIHKLFTMSK